MWFAALPLLLLSQTSADPVKLASIGFQQVRVPRALATSFEETFALRLSQSGRVRVTTPRDVASLVGAERQKQLLGCSSDSSCLTELAGALGAEGIITGEIALVGKVYQLTIKILSPADGRPMFQLLERCKGEEAVLEAIDAGAKEAVKVLLATLRKPTPVAVVAPQPVKNEPVVTLTAPSPAAPQKSAAPWVLLGAGAAVALGGGVAEVLAGLDYGRLKTDPAGPALDGLRQSGNTKQAIGLSMLGVGGAAVVGGLVWLALGAPAGAPTASAWVGDGSGGVVVGGSF